MTTDHATITRITWEVLEDMGADNVIFAELRTSPKVSCGRGWELSAAPCELLADKHRDS